MAILLRHVNDPPLTLSSVKPAARPRLSEWIERLLDKEPEERQDSAAAAWLALEEIVLDRLGPRWRRTARLTSPAAAQPTPATLPMPDDGGGRTRRHRRGCDPDRDAAARACGSVDAASGPASERLRCRGATA